MKLLIALLAFSSSAFADQGLIEHCESIILANIVYKQKPYDEKIAMKDGPLETIRLKNDDAEIECEFMNRRPKSFTYGVLTGPSKGGEWYFVWKDGKWQ